MRARPPNFVARRAPGLPAPCCSSGRRNEKPQPEDQPGLSLPRQHPRERTGRNTHGRLIQSECSAGVNAQNGLPLRRARQCAKASMPITIRMVPKCSSVNPARSSLTIGARQATKKSTIEIRSSRFPPACSTGQCNTACSLSAGVWKPKVFRGR